MARHVSSSSSLRSPPASVPAPTREPDLGLALDLDLAPLHELEHHTRPASRTTSHAASRTSGQASQLSNLPPRPQKQSDHGNLPLPRLSNAFPGVRGGSTSPGIASPRASASGSTSGSDTEIEGESMSASESEAYEHLPRIKLQSMLREARRVIRQRERDLELAARVGTALVTRNSNLAQRRGGGHSRNVSIGSSHVPSHSHSFSHQSHHSPQAHHTLKSSHSPAHHRHQSGAANALIHWHDRQHSRTHSRLPGSSPTIDKHAQRLRHASTLSIGSVRSADLHTHDYFDFQGREPARGPAGHEGIGHHHSVSDMSSAFSDHSGFALPSPREDGLVDADPLHLHHRVPSTASLRPDDDEVIRAHAREAETQRRLAFLAEENAVLIERLTQLQADTERNRRVGGHKLHALDHELKELRDELDAVLERNTELELQGQAESLQPGQPRSSISVSRDEPPWHHSTLLAGLGSLPDLDGQLSLGHTSKRASSLLDTSTMPPDESETPSFLSSLGASTPTTTLTTTTTQQCELDGSDPPDLAAHSVSAELHAAALSKGKAKGKHARHVSFPVALAAPQAVHHEETESLVKRLLCKIDELERTNIEMARNSYAIDGRLGQAIEDKERLRDAYQALDAGLPVDEWEHPCGSLSRPGLELELEPELVPKPAEQPRLRRRTGRGTGNRYAIAAQRLVNDVLLADLPHSPLQSNGPSPASEPATAIAPVTEMAQRDSSVVGTCWDEWRGDGDEDGGGRPGSDSGFGSGSFPEPGDHTAEVMDMLREIEELRQNSLPPMAEQWEDDNARVTNEDQAQIEMEDDIALVEAGSTVSPPPGQMEETEDGRGAVVMGDGSGGDGGDDNGHLRSLLRKPDDGAWLDEDQVLPLGALREPKVGTTADGYDLISEATGRRPLIWADDEDYGQPITVQQAERYGLVGAHRRGLIGSGWMVFVALRRALGYTQMERRRVNCPNPSPSALGSGAGADATNIGWETRRLQIQSTAQLEAELELRQLLRHRREQFERAVAGMRQRQRQRPQRPSSGSITSGAHRSAPNDAPRWEFPRRQRSVHQDQEQKQKQKQKQRQHQHQHRHWHWHRRQLSRGSGESEEILVSDLPEDRCPSSASTSHDSTSVSTSTEWLVDDATGGAYAKRAKPRSRRRSTDSDLNPKQNHSHNHKTRQGAGKRQGDGIGTAPNGKSRILQAIADPHVVVANARAKVDDVSNEVAALLTTWVAFASILVCAGVYMFSYVLPLPVPLTQPHFPSVIVCVRSTEYRALSTDAHTLPTDAAHNVC